MTDWLFYISLLVLLGFGWFINILTLPGLWVMVAAAIAYAWITDFLYLGWPALLSLTLIALLAEGVEFIAGGAGAKSAGGSKRGMLGAIIGAIIGGIFFTGLVPIPIVGTIIGVCLGAFLGAAVVEQMIKGDINHSMRVGVGAAKGRFWGILSKLAFGAVMFIVAAWSGLPTDAAPSPTPVVPVIPTTLPATLPVTNPL